MGTQYTSTSQDDLARRGLSKEGTSDCKRTSLPDSCRRTSHTGRLPEVRISHYMDRTPQEHPARRAYFNLAGSASINSLQVRTEEDVTSVTVASLQPPLVLVANQGNQGESSLGGESRGRFTQVSNAGRRPLRRMRPFDRSPCRLSRDHSPEKTQKKEPVMCTVNSEEAKSSCDEGQTGTLKKGSPYETRGCMCEQRLDTCTSRGAMPDYTRPCDRRTAVAATRRSWEETNWLHLEDG
jgi:hypothetical protein